MTKTAMQKDCVCFQLHVKKPSVRRKANLAIIDIGNTDADMLSVSKKLLDSAEYKRITHCVAEFKAFLRARALPSPMFRGGSYMIPIALIETVEEEFSEIDAAFKENVAAFVSALPVLIEDAKERLGDQFDEADYPTGTAMAAAFSIERLYIEIDAPGKLRTVSDAFFEKARSEWDVRFKKASEEAITLIRVEMKALVDTMVSQLGTTDDGKKKAFHASSIKKLTDFLDNFSFRNIGDDTELEKLTSAAKSLLHGVDIKSIRKDDEYRDSVQKTFSVMQERLGKLVVDKPSRKITFEEEA